jgi:lipoate-protein ligase B
VVDLGLRGFDETLALQRELVRRRQAHEIPDALVFVEHPPTYTIGRAGNRANLLIDESDLERMGAEFLETDRGGDITFHGPGQVVGYPIFDLSAWRRDVHAYLRSLEQVLLDALLAFGVDAHRRAFFTGVWHPRGKLAAIGVRVSRWVASHGFALNVSTDLRYFNHIVPCGIVGARVSSMEDVLQQSVAASPVKSVITDAFASVFDREMLEAMPGGTLDVQEAHLLQTRLG